MAELKPDDIFETYGAFNDLTISDKTPVGNRQTLSTTTAISKALEDYYTPDVLKGKSVYDGVIMATIATNSPTLQSNQALIEYLSDPPDLVLYYIYKIYIPEIEPRCINFSDRGAAGEFTNAQRVMTLPNAILDASIPANDNMRAIAAGTYVQVIFANQQKLKNPKIIAIGKKVIELRGLNRAGSLKAKFSNNRGTATGGGGNSSSGTFRSQADQLSRGLKGPKITWESYKKLAEEKVFQKLMETIAGSESGGDYDIGNRKIFTDLPSGKIRTTYAFTSITEVFGKDHTQVTIGEIIEKQKTGSTILFATGKYQQTHPTLEGVINMIVKNDESITIEELNKEMYSPDNQEAIALVNLLFKQGRTGQYFAGNHDEADQAAQSISYEWAGVPIQYSEIHKNRKGQAYPLYNDDTSKGIPLERGMSAYEQDGKNHAKKSIVTKIYDEVVAAKEDLSARGLTDLLA
ncbi:MAG TPA: hypothetical protein EYN67_09440 [Flavobacteriales bacterium]|nr:hypothetical protein [Flavobacteriales bacterium]